MDAKQLLSNLTSNLPDNVKALLPKVNKLLEKEIKPVITRDERKRRTKHKKQIKKNKKLAKK